MNKKIILCVLFFIHFFLIIVYSLKQNVELSITRDTYLSNVITIKKLQQIDYCLSKLMFHKISTSSDNDYTNLYMVFAGSKTPFIYFVANISPIEKLTFEIEFDDGSKKIVLPTVRSKEMTIRLKCLYTTIRKSDNEPYKELLIRKIAEHEAKNYSEVKNIKAILGVINIPTLNEFLNGQNLNFQYLNQYNFRIK
jgi:hypothetical protein